MMKPDATVEVMRPIGRMIVDPPPDWLLVALAHFGRDMVGDGKPFDIGDRFERMRDACDTLMKGLPAFMYTPFGLRAPNNVVLVLGLLPEVRRYIDRACQPRKGRTPNAERIICAGVIVEAWKRIHGRAKHGSDKVYETCEQYWLICGGKATDLKNWRRYVEKASAENANAWIREAMIQIEAQTPKLMKRWGI
jgi:hypothetical protein